VPTAWPPQRVAQLSIALDDVKALVTSPPHDQADEVTRALSRFLVVRTCGFLEQVVEECCVGYITARSSPHVASFGRSWFGQGASPKPGRLVQLVQRFDAGWGESLQQLFADDEELLRREISFLVDRRNKIAHGLGEGVGAAKALELLAFARQVADWFIGTFDPRSEGASPAA
jgi:hypothetical protein